MTYRPTWQQSEEQGTIRLLALWLLLKASEQAASKSSRIGENSVQVKGGRPAGRPPAPFPCPEHALESNSRTGVLRELHTLLERELKESVTPQETRRVAEILEFLDRDVEAYQWWEKAACRGDEDARDYLEILAAEGKRSLSSRPERCANEERSIGAFTSFVSGFVACHSIESRVSADRVDSAVGEAGDEPSEGTQTLVREIEDFLIHLDRTADGPRC
ncbi:hypothetical protein GCM10010306_104500 [Streptomyces umbrinus]|uniref:hypothetical protein n=1 Tax=Streptomyces umbrinus TaxID=67370 RepID=UPI0016737D47|nr:hypothetical protein [Streptomyces umbrinus]GHB92460.1 hypothetical protein GCM10010306_104500 [Streptomyces umbrinus]